MPGLPSATTPTRQRKRADSRTSEPLPEARRPASELIGVLLLVAAFALGVFLSYRLALPFLAALVWATVLAVLVAPALGKLERRVGNTGLAAFIMAAALAVIVSVPLLFIVQQLVREVADGAVHVEAVFRASDWREMVSGYGSLAAAADWLAERLDLPGLAGLLARWLTTQSGTLLRGSINQAIILVLVFYLLFYLLRDRHSIARVLRDNSPLNAGETERIVSRFVDTVHATIFGTVTVAAVQGTLGGLAFWWLGLPAPAFWGFVMGLLAILPVLGAFVIWVPAALFLALEGEWARAVILAVWGGVVIATIDNLLYPILVGNRLRLHTVLMFVGAVGGILVFGAPGLVLGPATIAVTLELLAILKERFHGLA
jgi:predicted PurR-regulated permease PerM